LKKMTSELVGRYVGATIAATKETGETLGRQHGQLVIPPAAEAEVRLLKTIAVLYVMDTPVHVRRQDRQRERVFRVFDYLTAGAPAALDSMFRMWWEQANTPAERQRVIIDQIASMTESRLERIARASAEFSGFLGCCLPIQLDFIFRYLRGDRRGIRLIPLSDCVRQPAH